MAASRPEHVLEVEVWFDFVCPWCFIGKRNFDAALQLLASRHPEASLHVTWQPYPLVPDTPFEGVPFQEFYRRRLGSADAVAARQAQVCAAAGEAGIAIAFDRIDVFPNTLAAHRLVLQAQREARDGGAHATELIDALFREYFLLGRDIGRADVLQALAARCAIMGDPDASPLPKSAALIDGVPFFRFGERISLAGALPPATLLNALERALGALDDDVQGGVTPA